MRISEEEMVDRPVLAQIGWLSRGLALVLGAILVRSAMYHVENSYAFLLRVESYEVLPPALALVVAGILPYLEMTIGVMLLFFPKTWTWAFGTCIVLFAGFAITQVITSARGLNINCGCFSPSDDNPIGIRSISIAAGCAVAALVGIVLTARRGQRCQASNEYRESTSEGLVAS
jgi:hypothetical protein